jgi:hypothetical protein
MFGSLRRNMKNLLPLILLATCLSGGLLHAQGTTGPTQTKPVAEEFLQDGVWTGSLKGGRYIVKCAQIIALSKHEYVADAAARVVEVNLTLSSNTAVRFYYLEPVRLEGNGVIAVGQQAIELSHVHSCPHGGVCDQGGGAAELAFRQPGERLPRSRTEAFLEGVRGCLLNPCPGF